MSILTIALVSVVAVGATRAYFSDTETSASNTFAAGTMNFRIARPGDTNHKIFSVSNLKPGQVVSGYFAVVNDSTAGLDMKWKAWIPSFNNGELDNVLEVKIVMNPVGFTEYSAFETAGYTIAGPGYNGGAGSGVVLHDWTPIHNLGSGNTILAWNYDCESAVGEPFRVDWAGIYRIDIRMQKLAEDYYQGKSFAGDINFYATQCENNL